ncbi:MAG: hypothetical protein ACLRP3_09975 [Escherichia sp.]
MRTGATAILCRRFVRRRSPPLRANTEFFSTASTPDRLLNALMTRSSAGHDTMG